MRRTIALAMAEGVALGAHPGYEDRVNFGRRAMAFPLDRVTDLVARQVELFATLAAEAGGTVHHVKPHGALYNQADRDADFAHAVVGGITKVSSTPMLYALPASHLEAAGKEAGLTICVEGFADRQTVANGSLMPRNEPGAILTDVKLAVAQGLALARQGNIETICVHGDSTKAASILCQLRAALEANRLTISSKPGN